jgi:N-acetylmuramoyl-L-alanine amidase
MLQSIVFVILTSFGLMGHQTVPNVNQNATQCLAENIYFEARNQPIEGQIAVAYVTLNRVANPAYPKTVCGVVKQVELHKKKCQFSWYCNGKQHKINEQEAWITAYAVAEYTLLTYNPASDPTHGALFYCKVGHLCVKSQEMLATIGAHNFYNIKHPVNLAGVWEYR